MDDGDPAPGSEIGSEIGGYRILSPLGSGGMGTVYRAADGGGAVVALKVLHPHVGADPAARARLRREVAALQRLRHPGVVAVLDAEVDSSEAFVVTELVDGLTLAEHVRRGGPLPPGELAELAAGLRDALTAVHERGVVHRDLKPSNVMLTARGPVLIDFGLAQAAGDAAVTSAGFVLGTPGYLAPELLADAEPSPATDWWGWAAVLAHAATGRPPFGTGSVDAVLARTRTGDVDLLGLDPALARPLAAALDREPRRRASEAAVVAALVAAASGEPPAASTQAITRATSALPVVAQSAGHEVGAEDARTRVLARDGSTRMVPVVPPSIAPGEQDAWRDTPPEDGRAEDVYRDDDVERHHGVVVEEEVPAWAAPRPRRRAGSVLALGALAVSAAMLYPGVTVLAVLVAAVIARTVGTAAASRDRARERRGGPSRGDTARTVATSPWHLLRAVVGLVPSVVVAASVVLVVGGLLWWLLETGRLIVSAAEPLHDGSNGPLAFAGAIGITMVLGLAALWFGPLTRLTRAGARRTLGVLAPGWSGAVVLVTLALAAAGVLVVLVRTGQPLTWWPLAGPPVLV